MFHNEGLLWITAKEVDVGLMQMVLVSLEQGVASVMVWYMSWNTCVEDAVAVWMYNCGRRYAIYGRVSCNVCEELVVMSLKNY